MRCPNIKFLIHFVLIPLHVVSQDIPTPALKQSEQICIKGATIHVGNGQVLEDAYLIFENGKILDIYSAKVGKGKEPACKTIDAGGKHIYQINEI